MADNQIIGATIQVDTGSSNANIKELNKGIGETKSSLKDAGDQAKVTGKSVEEAGGSFGKLKEQISSVPGPLGEAGEGVNKLSLAFKALLANPVVAVLAAIVGILALLYKAFENTFEGGEKMEQIFSGIKAAGQALLDNITKIAGAIVKIFQFDFSGAIADIKGVVSAVGDAYNKMAELTKQAQELHKEQLANDLDQAKRAKDLAILREQATDETIPIAKRKAALLELQKAAKEDAEKDIELSKKVTENKLAQLTLQKDGELKNRDEINKARIEQINVETDAANEQRRIAKQIALANKQEKAEEKAAAAAAAEERKKARQEYLDYTNKLTKLQQENELALTRDSYTKELKALENKIADEKRAELLAFEDKKITKAQYETLTAAIDVKAALEKDQLQDKHNKELAAKEAAFQKELRSIIDKTTIDGIRDTNEKEKLQLKLTYQEKLADAIKNYKDDAEKFQQIKLALDSQLRAEQDKLEARIKLEKEKKDFADAEKRFKETINNKKTSFEDKIKAVDTEQALVQKAFDDKIITETQYNEQVQSLADTRIAIHKAEMDAVYKNMDLTAQAFDNLSTIFGKQTAVGKAFAVASATISTIESAVKSFNAMADIPIVGPALGAVAAAAAIASGIANVKKIIAVPVPGQGSGGGSTPSVSVPAAPVAPTQQVTQLNQASIDSIGNAAVGRAYVLDADVSNNRDRDARLNRAARLGG